MSKNSAEKVVEEVIEEKVDVKEVQEMMENIMDERNPKWAEFILDELNSEEMPDGNPTTAGLRRVTQKVFGDIETSESLPPHYINSGYVSIGHHLVVRRYRDDKLLSVSAYVDVLRDKLIEPFNRHLLSTADTMAEGKALRRLLKVNLHTAEEIKTTELEEEDNDAVTDNQVLAVQALSKKNDVNVEKLVTKMIGVDNIYKMTKNDAKNVINKIGTFQRTETPKDLEGYDENWKGSKFGAKK
jgi:hypothetical protein